MNAILAVGKIIAGDVHWRVAPIAVVTVTDADVDALIDEVYGKPGLGIEDSAGLFDIIEVNATDEAYALGRQDYTVGRYSPPASNTEYDAYVRGYNDAWAATDNVRWWRKGSARDEIV